MHRPVGFHQQLGWFRISSQAIASYLESHTVRKLQLGTGTNVLDSWFNTDISPTNEVFFLDSTKPFPFQDATFHYIFSEHHIEHLSYQQGLFTLRECYRVLLPGGKIRIATPNLAVLLHLYTTTPDALQQQYMRFITDTFLPEIHRVHPAFVINNAFYNWGHRFLYDRATLQSAMEEAGFVDITDAVPGESDDEQLCGIEKHGEFIGHEELNRFETQILEGRRSERVLERASASLQNTL
ncbi:MAG TPA: methyltransferase domain-containing protein [Ktedonobacteraceae bacterium]|jgi:predicted SAM-dependent methyltransferase